MGKHVVIVGAGVIGAAAAFRLAGRGARVTVIDAGGGATHASFGWINASFYLSTDHFHLRAAGLEAFTRLARDLDVPVARTGCLSWEFEGDALHDTAATLTDLGYPAHILDRPTVQSMEPHLRGVPDLTLHCPTEQVAEPSALTQTLLEASGAQIVAGVQVTGFTRKGGRVTGVMTEAGPIAADDVLVAAGTGTEGLMALADTSLPMLPRPAYVMETKPLAPLLTHVIATQAGEIRQRPDGVIVMPTSVAHQADRATTLEVTGPAAADAALARLRAVLPDQPLEWARVTRANRPVPADDLPAVGRVSEGLTVAVMHSGLTLAAVMGDLLATEITDGPSNETNALLAPFRPQRFQ